MHSVAQWIAVGALGLAVAATVTAAVAMLWVRDVPTRLHYPAIAGSVGGPLLVVAVLLDSGPGLTATTVAVTMALVAITGPALSASIGKLNASGRVHPVRSADQRTEEL